MYKGAVRRKFSNTTHPCWRASQLGRERSCYHRNLSKSGIAIKSYGMSRLSRALLSCWYNQQYAYRDLNWLYKSVLHCLRTAVSVRKHTLSFASKMWICWVLFKFLLFKLSQQTSEFLFYFPKLLRIWLSSIQTIQTQVPVNNLAGLTVSLMFQVPQYQLSCECDRILNWTHLVYKDFAMVTWILQWKRMYWRSFMFKQIGRQTHI